MVASEQLFRTTQPFRILKYYPNYAVSDCAEVLSLNFSNTGRPKLLRPQRLPNGYRTVTLCKDGMKRQVLVHRLVATEFHGCPDGLVVNHKNGDKADNSADNLEWVTISDNAKHAYRIGLRKIGAVHRARAAEQGRKKRKITMKDANDIRWLFSTGRFSKQQLSEMYRLDRNSITKIINLESYLEATNG